ncbi:hypothetical protein Aph01nite_10620 [Acrocarpospora phusangensis]|uniref:Uncharacterized protein n=1 Tax=Acrocarpospora phusangensis TaxID=1070424 RepID=A0A919QAF1_9ACTN|nr:hypothetical protein [Acrocarpospora phusangensis]GIH22752.1 hypothetical protein Aph01nite_10620 [Acrocarpospora phusangensis]
MNPDDLIQSYVDDVARLLPRGQRRDVAYELRTLLTDELAAKAAESGRPADEAMAHELVLAFGRPAEAAARYHPALTVIDPADSRRFLRLTVIGIAVIWVLGLVDTLLRHPIGSAGDLLGALGMWWTGVAVPALWWPGVLVVCFAAAAWVRRTRPERAGWKPRREDRDRINRFGYLAGVAAAVCGLFVLFNGGLLLDYLFDGHAAPAAYQALALDEDFVRSRAPWLLALMVLQLALYAVLIVRGRWQPATRRIDIGLALVICGVLTWFLPAGDIFAAEPTDQTVKAVIVLIVIGALFDAGLKLHRELRRATYLPSM